MHSLDNNLPLVSIVAINYNNSKYVIETLDSIAAQTYPHIELIVVDDCSTDDSVYKIEQWLTNYKRPFQFIRSPKNEGVCATCNKGYKATQYKYSPDTILLVLASDGYDADDYIRDYDEFMAASKISAVTRNRV